MAMVASWTFFEASTRVVMTGSVFLAIVPVLAAFLSERIWLGRIGDSSRWSSGTASWDPPILQGNIGAFSRVHIETADGESLSGVMWRGRRKAWEGRIPVTYFADRHRIIVSPQHAVRIRVLRRS